MHEVLSVGQSHPDIIGISWHFDRLTNHKRCKTSCAQDKVHLP